MTNGRLIGTRGNRRDEGTRTPALSRDRRRKQACEESTCAKNFARDAHRHAVSAMTSKHEIARLHCTGCFDARLTLARAEATSHCPLVLDDTESLKIPGGLGRRAGARAVFFFRFLFLHASVCMFAASDLAGIVRHQRVVANSRASTKRRWQQVEIENSRLNYRVAETDRNRLDHV